MITNGDVFKYLRDSKIIIARGKKRELSKIIVKFLCDTDTNITETHDLKKRVSSFVFQLCKRWRTSGGRELVFLKRFSEWLSLEFRAFNLAKHEKRIEIVEADNDDNQTDNEVFSPAVPIPYTAAEAALFLISTNLTKYQYCGIRDCAIKKMVYLFPPYCEVELALKELYPDRVNQIDRNENNEDFSSSEKTTSIKTLE